VSAVKRMSKRLGRVRPHAIDGGLAVVVAVAVTIAISVIREPGARPPDTLAYALGVTIGALVLARRRWPMGVLVASVVTLQVYYLTNYPDISPAVPLAVALYTAAAAGHLQWSLGVAAWYLAGRLLYATFGDPGPLVPALNELVRDGALLVAVLLFGDAVRSHRALMAAAAERLRRAEEDRAREAQELHAARVIQQQLLPKELPSLPGWCVAAYYQPARAVGGDFYDFLELPDGQVALVTGDVTDKGIPAALVMATTHSILRGDAPGLVSPGAVLARANDRLYPDIPAHMFVTCLYAVLDPVSGRLRYANAGHNLPYVATADGVTQLRATGMPLGAMPGMTYEEHETYLAPGDSILFHSDGLVEAHNPSGEMFGFPRLQQVVANSRGSEHLIDACLTELRAFVGGDWEQEDDITLVTLQREDPHPLPRARARARGGAAPRGEDPWHILAEFTIPSVPGNERQAMQQVAEVVQGLDVRRALPARRLERLKTAVAEATMNAMEHGNNYRPELPVSVQVRASDTTLTVRITDHGGGQPIPEPGTPDLGAKLASLQTPRGWGLFLIKNMVDDMQVTSDGARHTVELIMHLQGDDHASQTA
jgi:serine phosphatase RsbU (regulator of sigma subunit)/anti-sigma regulatory factor (Ser/Thr protein kinase)